MARNKLSEARCRSLTEPGIYGDGDGLWLRVHKGGSKSWVFIWRRGPARNEVGLGGYGQGTAPVSVALARQKAQGLRDQLARGEDPSRPRLARVVTFGDCVTLFLDIKRKSLNSPKNLAGWELTLTQYALPLHDIDVAKLTVDDVVSCLEPHWDVRHSTATRLQARICAVIDYAIARKIRDAANPARWHGLLDKVMPPRKKLTRGHHKALDYSELPNAISRLMEKASTSARCAEFAVLTVGRSSEVREAVWSEIDFANNLWVIPAARMKMRRDHRVPLSARAIEILQRQKEISVGELVFGGGVEGRPISDNAVVKTLRGACGDDTITLHGMRSAFKDWCADCTDYPRELVEMSMAHVVKGVEAAYRRRDALEKRIVMMEEWAAYCTKKSEKTE